MTMRPFLIALVTEPLLTVDRHFFRRESFEWDLRGAVRDCGGVLCEKLGFGGMEDERLPRR